MKKGIIWGLGSIGKKHLGQLEKVGVQVTAISRSHSANFKSFATLEECLGRNNGVDFIWICTPTSHHHIALNEIEKYGYKGVVLIEKPIDSIPWRNTSHQFSCYVTYNLRHHEYLQSLKEILRNESVTAAVFYVGQNLTDWREGRDYRDTYSAKKLDGGGVLLDLSHEIDYAGWLLGDLIKANANISYKSHLEIETESSASIVACYEKCDNVTIHLNYLDRPARRFAIINTKENTYEIDFIKGIFYKNGGVIEDKPGLLQQTYKDQVLKLVNNEFRDFCDIESANQTVEVINCLKTSGCYDSKA